MQSTYTFLWIGFFLVSTTAAFAQGQRLDEEQRGGAYLDALPSPALRTGVGSSHVPITTRTERAQRYFDQGLSLWHGFSEFEAYRAFREAARLDSLAPMAYWGIYLSLEGWEERALERAGALEKVKTLAKTASEQERFYLRAAVVRDSLGGDAYQDEMEALVRAYPDDGEAQLLLARFLGWDSLYGQMLIRNVLALRPTHHGGHHYWIHAMEDRYPERALESAEALPGLAPQASHLVHMPGHVYYRRGDYAAATHAFVAAARVDSAYMAAQGIHPIDTWNYLHNLNYLLAALAEAGRYAEATRWATAVQGLALDPSRSRAPERATFFYQGLLAPAFLELRFGFWGRAAQRLARVPHDADLYGEAAAAYRDGLLAYARGMDAVVRHDLAEARRQQDTLDALLWRARRVLPGSRAVHLDGASLELRGGIESRAGRPDEALALLNEALQKETSLGYREPPRYIRSVRESLAAAYLALEDWENAKAVYEDLLAQRPHSGFALAGIANAHALAGDTRAATQAYNAFLAAWRDADPGLSLVIAARQWLDQRE